MNTATKILSALASMLNLAALACPVLCSAGPLSGVVHKIGPGRADNAARATGLSLAALRTNFGLAPHPLPLDTPRQAIVNLHEAQGRPVTEDAAEAGLHNPRGLHWQDGSAPISPTLVSLARNYHREGLPVVRLWQADRNMVSIGLNPHGVPGIYFTQKMGR